ncbi:N-acetyltransferase [Pseudoclavibacter sp. RFBJ3]|nr:MULTISPECIES: GNAT family N-acetyltransferase [unclassified Pseudoclavibacter]PPF87257.1 N-acetyltransferase [Pseudoclavibacter sp. RFBJ5]PPF88676.1 N-acetyltransferase [Pseudoclavibacter sp. RFBJ3]PPF93419.1 N-acetyltransferase [Pseudoclavibacter sp. RFBH5]PPG17569.1 N-acetyltransferase [Pseudoclavibacter sp. RFBI4]
MPVAIRNATHSDLSQAAATLAAAFDSYPWTRWSIPSDDYSARLKQLQAIYLTHALQHGAVVVSDDLAGVAALLPPGVPEPAESLQVEITELMGDRLDPVFGVELPPRLEKSWDLATIGVRPEQAGQGLGSRLLEECLRQVATSPSPRISLETSAERNVSLYRRHGFEVSHETQIADGPFVYTMSIEL